MVSFLDGPARGVTLALHRAPMFLRVVEGRGRWDALDQLDDQPEAWEIVHVYRKCPDGLTGALFACRGGGGGRYEMGEYRHVPDAPSEGLRGTDEWRAWVDKRAHEEGLLT